jgi:hypothetical protein
MDNSRFLAFIIGMRVISPETEHMSSGDSYALLILEILFGRIVREAYLHILLNCSIP